MQELLPASMYRSSRVARAEPGSLATCQPAKADLAAVARAPPYPERDNTFVPHWPKDHLSKQSRHTIRFIP